MKIKIVSETSWLQILLRQYFADLDFVTQAEDLSIIDEDKNLAIHLSKTGQDWSMAKPYSVIDVIVIIEQAKQILSKQEINIGLVKFFPSQRLCVFQDEEISLTQKESEILLYLFNHPYEVDKQTLLNEIWGYSNEISTHTLETHIYKLRSKFFGKYELITSSAKGYGVSLDF